MSNRTRAWLAVSAAALALGLSGCGGANAGSTADEVSAKAGYDGALPSAEVGEAVDQAAPLVVDSQYEARRASIAVQVGDIAEAATAVRQLASSVQGKVSSEDFGSEGEYADRDLTRYGQMTLLVPAAQLDPTLDRLADLGTVVSRSVSTEDVKNQYLDVDARLTTMQASVARLRALIDQAQDVSTIITLEAELSRRQADLDSLEAQLAGLKSSIAMSPVSVQLTTDGSVLTGPREGFLGGLETGWNAFTHSLVVLLAIVGALLPFLLLFALLALPLVWWVRRSHRLRRRTLPVPVESSYPDTGPERTQVSVDQAPTSPTPAPASTDGPDAPSA